MLKANRPAPTSTPTAQPVQTAPVQTQAPVQTATPVSNTPAVIRPSSAPVPTNSNVSAQIMNANAGVLDNIEGMGSSGNYVTMDGSKFLYKATETYVDNIDLMVKFGKRYYQWVEEDGATKIFHDSDIKIDDRYKVKFEIHWDEEGAEEGDVIECQFHMPTATAMNFMDYVKELAKNGFGVGMIATRMTISRQIQKNTTNKYSRGEFTMLGTVDAEGNLTEVANGISTLNKK